MADQNPWHLMGAPLDHFYVPRAEEMRKLVEVAGQLPGEGQFICGPAGQVLWMSPQLLEWLGHAAPLFVGRSVYGFVHPGDFGNLEGLHARLLKGLPTTGRLRVWADLHGFAHVRVRMQPMAVEGHHFAVGSISRTSSPSRHRSEHSRDRGPS